MGILNFFRQKKLFSEYTKRKSDILYASKLLNIYCSGTKYERERIKYMIDYRLRNLKEYFLSFKGLESEYLNEDRRHLPDMLHGLAVFPEEGISLCMPPHALSSHHRRSGHLYPDT